MLDETGRTRYEEYLICQERGHVLKDSRGSSTHRGSPDETQCVKCGTWVRWSEPKLIEREKPTPDQQNGEESEAT